MTASPRTVAAGLGLADRRDPRFNELTSAIVASGTSRLLILRDDELPPAHARHKIIVDLFIAAASLGGSHYQYNKVAVLGRREEDKDFSFHFYQVDPKERMLYATMECSNAASAAATSAKLLGLDTGAKGFYRSINLATRQQVELTPPVHWWNGDWGVRFTHLHHLWSMLADKTEEFSVDDRSVTGHVFRHGNVFVMASVTPKRVNQALVQELTAIGEAYARRTGVPPAPVKVLPYKLRTDSDEVVQCETTCYSEGQQHHSLPGSAAMAMSAFFTVQGIAPVKVGSQSAETKVHYVHPSGTMNTKVHLVPGLHGVWEIASTSFETPVRLLAHGAVLASQV